MKSIQAKTYADALTSSTQQINALGKVTVSAHSVAVHMVKEQEAG